MITPGWWSQPFPPTGAITSEGIRNQLGRPPVDPLTVFVRETGQNSWDARLSGIETRYRLELATVSPTRRPAWERLLTPQASVQQHLGVGRVVRSPNLRLLSVMDRGTKGLGGPIRADEIGGDRRDWVSFVLNVGEKRDTAQGGGTYGYGKAVLYRLSRVGTILVYTRTEEPDGELSSRLIGIAMGSSFDGRDRVDAKAQPYTGRHWWGDVLLDHVEPLRGADADDTARALGLPLFRPDESGTTLVVLDPDLEGFEDADAVGRHLADTIAWHMWPIMLPERGTNRLVPEVVVDGHRVDVPDPARHHPLKMFVAAYRRTHQDGATTLECGNPRRRLGRFALERAVVIPMPPGSASQAADYAGVGGDPHHVCLMRSPELVVRYQEGPQTASVNQAYAAVFRAEDDLDDTYAAAEPPTHDNWVYDQLTGHDKTFVKVTFVRIREHLAVFRTPGPTNVTTGGVPLGAASNFLGGLVAAAFAEPEESSRTTITDVGGGRPGRPVDGGGAPVGPNDGGQAHSRSRDRVRVAAVSEPRVEEHEDGVVLVQTFSVSGPGPVQLVARLSVATWDGREDDAPADAGRPMVRSWRTATGDHRTDSCMVESPSEVELTVVPVPDTVTEIVVTGTSTTKDVA